MILFNLSCLSGSFNRRRIMWNWKPRIPSIGENLCRSGDWWPNKRTWLPLHRWPLLERIYSAMRCKKRVWMCPRRWILRTKRYLSDRLLIVSKPFYLMCSVNQWDGRGGKKGRRPDVPNSSPSWNYHNILARAPLLSLDRDVHVLMSLYLVAKKGLRELFFFFFFSVSLKTSEQIARV